MKCRNILGRDAAARIRDNYSGKLITLKYARRSNWQISRTSSALEMNPLATVENNNSGLHLAMNRAQRSEFPIATQLAVQFWISSVSGFSARVSRTCELSAIYPPLWTRTLTIARGLAGEPVRSLPSREQTAVVEVCQVATSENFVSPPAGCFSFFTLTRPIRYRNLIKSSLP